MRSSNWNLLLSFRYFSLQLGFLDIPCSRDQRTSQWMTLSSCTTWSLQFKNAPSRSPWKEEALCRWEDTQKANTRVQKWPFSPPYGHTLRFLSSNYPNIECIHESPGGWVWTSFSASNWNYFVIRRSTRAVNSVVLWKKFQSIWLNRCTSTEFMDGLEIRLYIVLLREVASWRLQRSGLVLP